MSETLTGIIEAPSVIFSPDVFLEKCFVMPAINTPKLNKLHHTSLSIVKFLLRKARPQKMFLKMVTVLRVKYLSAR